MTADHSFWGVPAGDGDQLPLGAFEETPLLPVAPAARTTVESDAPAAYRELPVCGEWTYDSADDSESRGGTAAVETVPSTATAARAPASPVATVRVAAPVPRSSPTPPVTQAAPSPMAARNAWGAGSVPSTREMPPAAPSRLSAAASAVRPVAAPSVTVTPARAANDISPRVMRPPLTPRLVPKVPNPPTPLPALDELKSQHEAHPGDARTAISLAAALDKRGNIAAALGVLQRAIDAGAESVPLRCARATILSGRLRYDDAEAELKRATKVHPDDPDLLLQLGILACRRAKWRDAVEPLARLVKLDSASAQAHFYLGEALNKIDRLPDALAAYEMAAELDGENWRALKGVGIVLDRMGRPAEAAAYYRRARDAQSG